jgi:hypothetical protein
VVDDEQPRNHDTQTIGLAQQHDPLPMCALGHRFFPGAAVGRNARGCFIYRGKKLWETRPKTSSAVGLLARRPGVPTPSRVLGEKSIPRAGLVRAARDKQGKPDEQILGQPKHAAA